MRRQQLEAASSLSDCSSFFRFCSRHEQEVNLHARRCQGEEKVINPAIANSHALEGNPGVDDHHDAKKNAQNQASEMIEMFALDP